MTAPIIFDRVEIVETGETGVLTDVRVDVERDRDHTGPEVRMRPKAGTTRYGVRMNGRLVWFRPSEIVKAP